MRLKLNEKILNSILKTGAKLSLCFLMSTVSACTSEPKKEKEESPYWEEIALQSGDKYKHLTWVDSKQDKFNFFGNVYDTKALEEEYGNLWPFALELSEQEVLSAFDYLIFLFREMKETWTDTTTYVKREGVVITDQAILQNYSENKIAHIKKILEIKDGPITKYQSHYIKTERSYATLNPPTFYSQESNFGIGEDNKKDISFEDKDWFVREFILGFLITKDVYTEMGKDPVFYFNQKTSSNNFDIDFDNMVATIYFEKTLTKKANI